MIPDWNRTCSQFVHSKFGDAPVIGADLHLQRAGCQWGTRWARALFRRGLPTPTVAPSAGSARTRTAAPSPWSTTPTACHTTGRVRGEAHPPSDARQRTPPFCLLPFILRVVGLFFITVPYHNHGYLLYMKLALHSGTAYALYQHGGVPSLAPCAQVEALGWEKRTVGDRVTARCGRAGAARPRERPLPSDYDVARGSRGLNRSTLVPRKHALGDSAFSCRALWNQSS